MLKRNSSKVQSEAAGVKGSSKQPTIHNESCLIHYRRKSKKGGQKKEKQGKKLDCIMEIKRLENLR